MYSQLSWCEVGRETIASRSAAQPYRHGARLRVEPGFTALYGFVAWIGTHILFAMFLCCGRTCPSACCRSSASRTTRATQSHAGPWRCRAT